jgi:nucleoside-diphosphate-sugar epimerase
MRILLTGASSFTGYWFARALAEGGHAVHATFGSPGIESYCGLRRRRVDAVLPFCTPAFGCRFGDERFLALLGTGSFDLVCHHGAEVTGYRSPDFDAVAALRANTHNARATLQRFAARGGRAVILTGSIYEAGEGATSGDERAFSPYGLSKTLTYQALRFYCEEAGLTLAKFVIPNPFGPFEEPRFAGYVMTCWARNDVAHVRSPEYVRDQIAVSLLSRAYVRFAEDVSRTPAARVRYNPSGNRLSMADFTDLLARRVRELTGRPCPYVLHAQQEFAEPRVRVNVEDARDAAPDWDEAADWRDYAAFYRAEVGL